jgi:hypothetical protein
VPLEVGKVVEVGSLFDLLDEFAVRGEPDVSSSSMSAGDMRSEAKMGKRPARCRPNVALLRGGEVSRQEVGRDGTTL